MLQSVLCQKKKNGNFLRMIAHFWFSTPYFITFWDVVPLKDETGSRSPCMRPRSDPSKMKNSNVVRSRLIILINEEINEANWMLSNSAKLDRRTKQHTQPGVSASNGSRDMAATKSWRKKKKNK